MITLQILGFEMLFTYYHTIKPDYLPLIHKREEHIHTHMHAQTRTPKTVKTCGQYIN